MQKSIVSSLLTRKRINEDVNNNITVAVTPTKVIPMYLQQN
jgi:hypothetical protein